MRFTLLRSLRSGTPIPHKRHNFYMIGAEFLFFALALALINPNTLLPSLAAGLGASSIFVGFITSLVQFAWNIPQIFAGPVVARRERKKPLLLTMIYIGRPTVLLLALMIWLTGGQPAWLIMAGLVVMVVAMFGTDSFAGVAWLDMLGKAFPNHERAGYMSVWQAAASVSVLAISGYIAFTLSDAGPPFPMNYARLIALSGTAFMISAVFLTLMREPEPESDEPATMHIAWSDFIGHLTTIWRHDHRFRQITLGRFFLSLSTIAFPFYVIYATEVLVLPERIIGLFIAAQTGGTFLGSLIAGRLADRHGPHVALRLVIIVMLSGPLLALLIATMRAPILIDAYLWIYVCIGLLDSAILIGFFNAIIAIAPRGERPIYIGASNAISSIGMVGPVLGGWLLGFTSYSMLFALSGALTVIALAMILSVRIPQTHEAAM